MTFSRDVTRTSPGIPCLFLHIFWSCLDCVLGATNVTSRTTAHHESDGTEGMVKGLAAGFGAFFGLIIIICCLWCCCCTGDDSPSRCCCEKNSDTAKVGNPGRKIPTERGKVAPSPPQSAAGWNNEH